MKFTINNNNDRRNHQTMFFLSFFKSNGNAFNGHEWKGGNNRTFKIHNSDSQANTIFEYFLCEINIVFHNTAISA